MPRRGTRLTGRGLALLLCGAAATAGAAWLGERDLVWLGLALTSLPLLAAVYLQLARPRVSQHRTLTPDTVAVGSATHAVLQVANQAPAQASALQFVDDAPAELGGGVGFVIARGFGRWRQAVGYTLQADMRGRFEVGPLLGTASDPFGLARRRFTAAGGTSLLRVTPRIWPLGDLAGGAGLGAAGDATPQRIGQAGQDDVLVREHRHGDGMRRVHWRMTAKQGDLMVRLEEHPWDPSSTLIVDTRRSAHLGSGPTGSLEWAVSAVASIAALLVEGRYRLAVLAPSGAVFASGHTVGHAARHAMLEALTELDESEETWLGTAVADPEALATSASLVAATGMLHAADAAALAAAGGRARSLIALVPDARAWGRPSEDHDDACRLLRNHGWTVETYRPGEPVPDVWGRVAR